MKEALEQPDCNSHPKAPHGFNRDASHSADRYVCDCEGWDAWQDGYDEGLRKGLAMEQSALTDEKGRPMTYWGGLEQPAQEPVAWMELYKGEYNNIDIDRNELNNTGTHHKVIPLYTRPSQPLSDDEIENLYEKHKWDDNIFDFARAIEQALKVKNHA
jgi:hypothetical protein